MPVTPGPSSSTRTSTASERESADSPRSALHLSLDVLVAVGRDDAGER